MSSHAAQRSLRPGRTRALADMSRPLLCLLSVFTLIWPSLSASTLGPRDFKQLTSDGISSLVAHPDPIRNVDPNNPSSHLSQILIPRVSGTENNTIVRNYIIDTLKKLNWHIEEDSFNNTTPYGLKPFTNIIATKDPKAPRRVILSAHYDSKYFSNYPDNQVRRRYFTSVPCEVRAERSSL